MAVKLTMLFQLATNADFPNLAAHRLAGWSESWYQPAGTPSNTIQMAISSQLVSPNLPLALARAALLPSGAAIVGLRAQTVDPAGPGQALTVAFTGSIGPADVPQMALQCHAQGIGVRNRRIFELRGMPDAYSTEGELNLIDPYRTALAQYFKSIQGWYFRGRDLAQVTTRIVNITAAGIVTINGAFPGTASGYVRVLRTTNVLANKVVGGVYHYNPGGSGTTTVALDGWNQGVCIGGNLRPEVIIYPAPDPNGITFDRVMVRKVGRPFGQYRGRRSKRKN